MNVDPLKRATLSAVIEHNLAQLQRLNGQLESLLPILDRPPCEYRDLAAIAYLLHNIYSAIENSFDQISRTFENHIVDTQRWHRELLDKMFLNIAGVRPAVLPDNLRSPLNDLRGFRHLFRHSYDFELDSNRLRDLTRRWSDLFPMLGDAFEKFRSWLLSEDTG
ncbi:MAG TPA: antitoxin [Candidatus Paceibacterota bacterium]|nr:antitoxin [Verrucomicrobiota bacterium]HRZ56157.1 antitoxin [Candidatus Paceibacterota bacterium]